MNNLKFQGENRSKYERFFLFQRGGDFNMKIRSPTMGD